MQAKRTETKKAQTLSRSELTKELGLDIYASSLDQKLSDIHALFHPEDAKKRRLEQPNPHTCECGRHAVYAKGATYMCWFHSR